MLRHASITSIYAADTSGVASALFELGGLTVIHDPSGCNSTYTTHDEPRWADFDSMFYVSGLTEKDAIMGNDEKVISDLAYTAERLNPEFIAICGSPMPMMVGTDFDALAYETEKRTGIKTFAFHTNGMNDYISGEEEAFYELVKYYSKEKHSEESGDFLVNVIGATPIDMTDYSHIKSISDFLEKHKMKLNSCLSMGCKIPDIEKIPDADANLAVSYSGIKACEYLNKKFGQNYAAGLPFGEKFSEKLADALKSGKNINLFNRDFGSGFPDIVIEGESVFSLSLSSALYDDFNIGSSVICPLKTDKNFLGKNDFSVSDENEEKKIYKNFKTAVADNLYKPIIPKNCRFVSLPSVGFSGRCFLGQIPDLSRKSDFQNLVKKIISK